MNIDSIMEKEVVTCGPEDTLESAAILMWNNACGAVPIVSEDGRALGLITDRDIAMASALQHKPLWQIKAQEVCGDRGIVACQRNATADEALQKMGENGVRRLLVLDSEGRLEGLISMDDAICEARRDGDGAGIGFSQLVPALQEVCRHQGVH
jgi:CBS domain-containing protein